MRTLSTDSEKILEFLDQFKIDKTSKIKISSNLKSIYKNVISSFKKIDEQSVMTELICMKKLFLYSQKECNLLRVVKTIYPNPQLQKYLQGSFTDNEKLNLKNFINNLDDMSNTQCDNWMNLYGAKLLHNFNMLIDFGKIPKNILNIDDEILGIYNQFCPLDIQREIETKHNTHCLNKGSFEDYSVNLDIHTKNYPTIRTVKTLNNYALLMLYLSKNVTDNVNLKLFLTGKKKYLPTKYTVLGPKEINTGSTMKGINGTIKIWRKEELYKLILHEMIHFLNLDFKSSNKLNSIYSFLYKVFNISQEQTIRLTEAYTETIACIINTIIVSYKFGDKSNLTLFKKMIDYERIFSCFQIAKILYFYGYKNFDEFFNLSGQFNTNPKWNQTTNVFSYHIIKGAFIFSINSFIDFCVNNNKQNWLQFDSNNPNIYKEFQSLIKHCCSDSKFRLYINKFMNFIRTNENKKLFIYRTLRMTALELY